MVSPIIPGAEFGSARRSRSFSWSNILTRLAWATVWTALCRWTPPQLYGWRRLILVAFGAKIARGARVYSSARIWLPSNLEMGVGAVIGPGVECYCMDKIVLEDFAEVAQYVHLVTGTHDINSPLFQLFTKPIKIRSYAWLASGAFVGPGVTVGEGAVLGARAVAFRDLDPWTVYVGNPAVAIKQRTNVARNDQS